MTFTSIRPSALGDQPHPNANVNNNPQSANPANDSLSNHPESPNKWQRDAPGAPVAALRLAQAPPAALTLIGQQLTPRDIANLGRTCKQLLPVQQRMQQRICNLRIARMAALTPNGLTWLNAPPAVHLKLEGPCAHLAALSFGPAPWVRRLDVRNLTDATATTLIALASLHPNAEVALTSAQQTLIRSHYLGLAGPIVRAIGSTHAHADALGALQLDDLQRLTDSIPRGLVRPCTLAVCQFSSLLSLNGMDDDALPEGAVDQQLQNAVKLAIELLERCERDSLMETNTRLLLATEGIRCFPWNTPVSWQHHLLLLSKVANALSGRQSGNPLFVHGVLLQIGRTLDVEHELKRSSRLTDVGRNVHNRVKVSPISLLATLNAWGIALNLKDGHGLTAVDRLRNKHLRNAANLLEQAITHVQRGVSRPEQSARRLHSTLCIQS